MITDHGRIHESKRGEKLKSARTGKLFVIINLAWERLKFDLEGLEKIEDFSVLSLFFYRHSHLF